MHIADKTRERTIRIVLLFLSILVPSCIGGLRDLSVGKDVLLYGTEFFQYAKSCDSIRELFENMDSTEYGYFLLNYLCVRFCNNIHFFLWFSEFFKLSLMIAAVWFFRKKVSSSIIIFSYMIFFWILGLSMLRQSLALSLCFYSLTFYYNKKFTSFILIVLTAYFFHNSAFAMLFLPIADLIFYIFKKRAIFIIGGITGIAYMMAIPMFIYIVEIGLVRADAIDMYLDSGVNTPKTNILILLFIFISTFFTKRNKIERYTYTILTQAIFCLCFILMSTFFEVAFRMSYYQSLVLFIIYPFVIQNSSNRKSVSIYNAIYILVLFFHYITAVKHGLDGCIPYKSEILGIT